MDTVKKIKKARAKLAENRTMGIKPPNPIERAKQNPNSRVLAIKAFCYECMGFAKSWRNDVRDCTAKNCPLYRFRPYKK